MQKLILVFVVLAMTSASASMAQAAPKSLAEYEAVVAAKRLELAQIKEYTCERMSVLAVTTLKLKFEGVPLSAVLKPSTLGNTPTDKAMKQVYIYVYSLKESWFDSREAMIIDTRDTIYMYCAQGIER